MNTEKKTNNGDVPQPSETFIAPNIKIKIMKLKMIMWPEIMFANKRTINAKGFVKILMISTGRITNRIGRGTPGVQKMCDQYPLLPFTFVIIKVITARDNVTAILPVKLRAPGSNPNKFPKRIKKNRVSIYGKNFAY